MDDHGTELGRVVVGGGSGFIGRALVAELANAGYEVVVLSRTGKPVPRARVAVWDAGSVADWAKELDGAKSIVNLTGETITGLWTEDRKRSIVASRIESARAIGEAIKGCVKPPESWVNASAVGYYGGDTGDRPLSEASPPGDDFLARVARLWEGAVDAFDLPATRTVKVRVGFVLDHQGGALPPLALVTKMFLGGPVGSGKQYVSWVHLRDVVRLLRFAIEKPVSGPLNATAPNPVTNAKLMAELRHVLARPPVPAAPEWLFSPVANLLRIEPDLILGGQRALPVMTRFHGFEFEYPDLRRALENALKS
ncbi:MAG: TIGR01777 family oxidoreductase [Fimbriimonadaceae bacterium]|nr:TIGR01777 family oxidoreductase [Fimbriimonadaceae bacterium]